MIIDVIIIWKPLMLSPSPSHTPGPILVDKQGLGLLPDLVLGQIVPEIIWAVRDSKGICNN